MPLYLTLGDLERKRSRYNSCQTLICRIGLVSQHILILSTDRKSCIGNPVARSDLTVDDFKRSRSRLAMIDVTLLSPLLGNVE